MHQAKQLAQRDSLGMQQGAGAPPIVVRIRAAVQMASHEVLVI